MSRVSQGLPGPQRGRPRDARIDGAVLRATSELLVERGYADLNVGEVAERAGTTKTAIYRRWKSKAHLVHEAAFPIDAELAGDAMVSADGPLDIALREMVATTARLFSAPAARAALPGLISEFHADPTLHATLLARFREGPLVAVSSRLTSAIGSGEARSDLIPETAIEAIAGTALLALVFDPAARLDDDWVDRTTQLILRGIRA